MRVALPPVTVGQLVLVEVGAAAVVGGIAQRGGWLAAGIVVAAVLLLAAVTPVGGRWLYQLGQSFVAMLLRRRTVRGPGMQSLLGGYRITTVPAGRQGTTFGAVAVAGTWTVPLEVALDRVLNDDAAVPVEQLSTLLQVEDVPMSSVRLVTVVAPAARRTAAPTGPDPVPAVVARYVLVTLDLRTASAAVAARGGSDAAVAQILRRCALRAEEVLAANGLTVRRLDEAGVTTLFGSLFGPSSAEAGGALPPTVETWHDIRVGGTWSMSFAVRGAGADLADRAMALVSSAAVPVAVTSLLLRRTARGAASASLVLRVSGPGQDPDRSVATGLADRAREVGLTLQRLDGEQGAVLRATTPVGVGAGA